jgi:hypothetical protein
LRTCKTLSNTCCRQSAAILLLNELNAVPLLARLLAWTTGIIEPGRRWHCGVYRLAHAVAAFWFGYLAREWTQQDCQPASAGCHFYLQLHSVAQHEAAESPIIHQFSSRKSIVKW